MKPTADVLAQAADWLVLLHSGVATDADRQAIRHWQQESPAHAQAWQCAERFLQTLQDIPPDISKPTLSRSQLSRRHVLGQLALLMAATPALWLTWQEQPWRTWTAHLKTNVGQQRRVTLPDGSRLIMNTNSAANIDFSTTERRITLISGEIHIDTAHDSAQVHRPFLVATADGTARALGTRFSMRQLTDRSQVVVFEGAVAITPRHAGKPLKILHAGEQATFNDGAVQERHPVSITEQTWTDGMLIARQMRMADLLTELSRYRAGILQCDPAIADIRISGAFSLTDSDHSLQLLADTFPVQIRHLTRYWTRVGPA